MGEEVKKNFLITGCGIVDKVVVSKYQFFHLIEESVHTLVKSDIQRNKNFLTRFSMKFSKNRSSLIIAEHFVVNSYMFFLALQKQKFNDNIIEEVLSHLYTAYKQYLTERDDDCFYERLKEYESIITEDDSNMSLHVGNAILKNTGSSGIGEFETALITGITFLKNIESCVEFVSRLEIIEG